jgi:hypothetical protein
MSLNGAFLCISLKPTVVRGLSPPTALRRSRQRPGRWRPGVRVRRPPRDRGRRRGARPRPGGRDRHRTGRRQGVEPAGGQGQIEGGIARGLGLALMEEIQLQDGRVRNPSFTDHLVPTILDMPPVRMDILELSQDHAPYGLNGVGEPSTVSSTPAAVGALRAVPVRLRPSRDFERRAQVPLVVRTQRSSCRASQSAMRGRTRCARLWAQWLPSSSITTSSGAAVAFLCSSSTWRIEKISSCRP